MFDSEDDWDRVITGLRQGDDEIVGAFCSRYGAMLEQVADKHLSPQVRRRVEPEDVVQSACRTFFRRVSGGEFVLPDSDALWRLLCAIVVTKVREQARFHLRKKRGLDREVAPALAAQDSQVMGFAPMAAGPTPAEAAEFADQLRRILEALDPEERRVVDLKLADHTNDEVATQMGCSERTVRRLLKRIEDRLVRALTVN